RRAWHAPCEIDTWELAGLGRGERRPPADASQETRSGYTSVCRQCPAVSRPQAALSSGSPIFFLAADRRLLRSFLLCRALERFVEYGIGCRRGLTELDVRLVDRDGWLEAFLV